jgi:hypothetical protein
MDHKSLTEKNPINWKRERVLFDSPAPVWAAYSEKYTYAIGVYWDEEKPDIHFVVKPAASC